MDCLVTIVCAVDNTLDQDLDVHNVDHSHHRYNSNPTLSVTFCLDTDPVRLDLPTKTRNPEYNHPHTLGNPTYAALHSCSCLSSHHILMPPDPNCHNSQALLPQTNRQFLQ